MLQSDVFSAYNCEWLNRQTLEKTTEFYGPSVKVLISESRLTLNAAHPLANWDITPLPSLQSYPRKNNLHWEFSEFSSVCVYTLKMKQIGAIYWRLNPLNDIYLKHAGKWFGRQIINVIALIL